MNQIPEKLRLNVFQKLKLRVFDGENLLYKVEIDNQDSKEATNLYLSNYLNRPLELELHNSNKDRVHITGDLSSLGLVRLRDADSVLFEEVTATHGCWIVSANQFSMHNVKTTGKMSEITLNADHLNIVNSTLQSKSTNINSENPPIIKNSLWYSVWPLCYNDKNRIGSKKNGVLITEDSFTEMDKNLAQACFTTYLSDLYFECLTSNTIAKEKDPVVRYKMAEKVKVKSLL